MKFWGCIKGLESLSGEKLASFGKKRREILFSQVTELVVELGILGRQDGSGTVFVVSAPVDSGPKVHHILV